MGLNSDAFPKPLKEEMQPMWPFIFDLLLSCGFERNRFKLDITKMVVRRMKSACFTAVV